MNHAPLQQQRPIPLMLVLLCLAAAVWLSILQYVNVHFAMWLRLALEPMALLSHSHTRPSGFISTLATV